MEMWSQLQRQDKQSWKQEAPKALKKKKKKKDKLDSDAWADIFASTHTYKSPTMTCQMKKGWCVGWRGMLVYKHPVREWLWCCWRSDLLNLVDIASVIKHRSIWSHTWPGSLDFTHGFKSSKHDETLDSLLISPAGLAYTSDSRQTHTRTCTHTHMHKANKHGIIICSITAGLVPPYFWTCTESINLWAERT